MVSNSTQQQQHKPAPEQIQLEEKAESLLKVHQHSERPVEEVFGPMEDWIFQISDEWKLLLIPFTGQWLFFDSVHDDWQDTGHKAGEVVFFVENRLLESEVVTEDAVADDEDTLCQRPASFLQ